MPLEKNSVVFKLLPFYLKIVGARGGGGAAPKSNDTLN